ncbi:MAG TPA: SRPBCC family protein [Flavobacterium sp.]|jgi:effector-binding domain-containing protein
MRILKYILLLLLLIAIGITVYVATQKGDFDITRSRIIKTPRNAVFNYINDYQNWESWAAWGDSGTDFEYPQVTAGQGASFIWDGGLSEGSARTLFVKENDSIAQELVWNGYPGIASWKFTDTVGGTKVTWRIKGKMGFMPKIYAALEGGAEAVMGTIYENSLARLDKVLDREINTYKITVDGVVTKPGGAYLYQSITSTIENMPKNMRIMMTKLRHFFSKNKIASGGKPFVLYDTFDTAKGITKFSVCIPVKDTIHTAPGSDISSASLTSFRAVKTTLKGDHSHLKEAWDKSFTYIKTNNLNESENGSYLEIYQTGKGDVKSHAQWVTEIYIPVSEPAVQQQPVAVSAQTPAAAQPVEPEEEFSIP